MKDYDVLMSFHVKQPQIYFFYLDLNIPKKKKKTERDDHASMINVPVCKLLIKTAITHENQFATECIQALLVSYQKFTEVICI